MAGGHGDRFEADGTNGAVQPFEKEYMRKDGHCAPILVGAAGFDEPRDERVVFVVDLTGSKRVEAQASALFNVDTIHDTILTVRGDLLSLLKRSYRAFGGYLSRCMR